MSGSSVATYERVGDGPPVVLLHGYVGDGPTTWRRQLEALGGEFTLIAWDAPGAGRSSDPPETFGMAGYADCLAGFIAELGLERPARRRAVVRWCAGDRTGPSPPNRRPTPGPGVGVRRVGRFPARRRHRAASAAGARAGRPLAGRVRRHALPTMFSEATAHEMIDAFAASMRAFHPIGFRAMARASAEDLRDALPCVEVPTLLVYGDLDVRRRSPSTSTSMPRSPVRPSSSCPAQDMSATSMPLTTSTPPGITTARAVPDDVIGREHRTAGDSSRRPRAVR